MKKKYSVSMDEEVYEEIPIKNKSVFINTSVKYGLMQCENMKKQEHFNTFKQIVDSSYIKLE